MGDWSSRTWLSVPSDDDARVYHLTGTRPGHPTAGLVFHSVFAFSQIKLVGELRGSGLLPVARLMGISSFSRGDGELAEVTPPSFMDDLVAPVTEGNSLQSFKRVEIVDSDGIRLGGFVRPG